jgi:hypothetical protein
MVSPEKEKPVMRNRPAILAAATVIALLITGLAWAASDGINDVTSTETNVAIAVGQQQTIPVDTAGSVVLLRSETQLQILSVIPNPGYVPEIELAAGREVEADFRGEGRRVKFNAELEDGQVRLRIEIDNDANPRSTASTSSTGSTSSTSSTTSTGSTASTSSTSSASSTTSTQQSNIPNGTVTYSMGAAGTVTINFNNGRVSIVSINTSAGWSVDELREDTDKIEIELQNGDSEVEFKLDTEAGLKVEVKSDIDGSGDDNSGSGSGGDDDDDNSGSGSGGDDDDDNSGSGSGGDDDDDNSGSGSGGDDNNDEDNSGSGG